MHLHRLVAALVTTVVLAGVSSGPAAAQAPTSIDGELVVVPVFLPGAITVDGDLRDWADVPAIVTTSGPAPSSDPAIRGEMRWQLAATSQNIVHFAATISDDQITVGQDDSRPWNEDSIELYLNVADPAHAQYGDDGLGQIRISAVDVGNSEQTALTLTGNGVENFDVAGFVFEVSNGWGLEIAVNVGDFADVIDGATFGVQVHANGASGGDRDLKLIWSNADVNDTSYEDPSVFGTGQFVFDERVNAEPVDDAEVADTEVGVEEESTVVDAIVTEAVPPDSEPEPRRTLFYAAIFSAVSVIVGGLWLERWRKRSEAKMDNEEIESGLPR